MEGIKLKQTFKTRRFNLTAWKIREGISSDEKKHVAYWEADVTNQDYRQF